MSSSNKNESRRDVHCPLCSYPSTLKSTKTSRLMLRCDNCKLLMFANGHLSQQQLKALPNVVADQQHYNNNSNYGYW